MTNGRGYAEFRTEIELAGIAVMYDMSFDSFWTGSKPKVSIRQAGHPIR